MTWKVRVWNCQQIAMATWKYLNQPLFDSNKPMVGKISRFWYCYKISMLEKCLKINTISQRHYTQ